MKNKKKKTIYYQDELNDDFSGKTLKTIKVDKTYKYLKNNFFWKICSFFLYRLIMIPFAFFYNKIKFHQKFVNRKVLKIERKNGYFIYANHTLEGGDAFTPNLVNFPKRTYTIVHADNLSIKGLKNFNELNGAIPIPTQIDGMRNFMNIIKFRAEKNNVIQIYPEAHIWPYYTKIRHFKSVSFKYPVMYGKPVYCFTNTFHKKRVGKIPKIITYIDGPFYPDKSLSNKEQVEDLCNKVYQKMTERSKQSTYEYIKYKKTEEK